MDVNRRAAAAAGAVVLGLALAAGTAVAAPAPVDPEYIGVAAGTGEAAPFVSPIGEQLVFWVDRNGDDHTLAVRARQGGAFGQTQELDSAVDVVPPQTVAFDSSGDAFVAWTDDGDWDGRTRFATRPAQGLFSAARTHGDCRRSPATASGPGDRFALACSTWAPHPWPFAYDQMRWGIGYQARPVDARDAPLDPVPDDGIAPAVAWGADGTLAIAWDVIRADDIEVHVLVVRPDGSKNADTLVTSGAAPDAAAMTGVAVQRDGTAVVAVATPDGAWLYRKPPGRAVGPRAAVGPAGSTATDLSTDAAGVVHLLVTGERSGGRRFAETRMVSPTGTVSGAIPVAADAADLRARQLLTAPDGTEQVTIEAGAGISVASRGPGAAAFGAPRTIAGADARRPRAALTSSGDVLVAWIREMKPAAGHVMVGGLDSGAPPAITIQSPPSAMLVGVDATFSADVTDSMGVDSVTWDFGDGTKEYPSRIVGPGGRLTRTGPVSHAYWKPGDYTVSVTAVDRAGNVASKSQVVSVKPVGVWPPPVPDTGWPQVTVQAPDTIRFKRLRSKGVLVRATPSKAAKLTMTLVGRFKRARIARTGDVVLAEGVHKTIAAGPRSLRLRPDRRLLGKRRALTLTIRVTAADFVGRSKTRSVKLRVKR